ncbi:unnamed protein product [Caenorhabditis brenneri]
MGPTTLLAVVTPLMSRIFPLSPRYIFLVTLALSSAEYFYVSKRLCPSKHLITIMKQRLMCVFEVFATLFINLIYLSMLHLTAVESGLSFLAITFFLFAAFFLFAMISICQWTIEDSLTLLASKLFSYQLVQVVLFLFCTLCVIRLTMRQDTEKKKPLRTFLPHYILTYCSVVLFMIAPRTAFLYAVLMKESGEEDSSIMKAPLFVTPVYNFFFVILINCQDPERRSELKKSIERAFRGIKTGPIPRINVQEPTSSSALPSRSHIALNLMRNPLNSFNKLQRQSATAEIPPQNSLRVPRDQRYFATDDEKEDENQVSTPEEILTSRNSEERGFMTVAMLRRASQISQRFQGIRSDSARTDSARTPSQSARSQQKIECSPRDQNIATSSRQPSPSPRRSQPLDVSQLLGFFITSSTSSVAMTIPVRNKRAVERIREVLHREEPNPSETPETDR